MATWIVHLRLAERLLPFIDGLDPSLFAVGNVAPDSGVPDEKWQRYEPPPEVTHFRVSAPGREIKRCADLAFYERYLLPLRGTNTDVERFSFLLGYFFHLVTDNLWASEIYLPTRRNLAAQFAADPDFINEVKRDWYGLDLEYVRNHPGSLFWRVFLHSEYNADYLDFLPTHAIQRSLDYIKSFYQRRDEEMEKEFGQRPGLYLTAAEMNAFIDRTTSRLLHTYQRVWNDGADADGACSVDALPMP